GTSRRLARHGRFGAAKADLRRSAEAALDRCAVHTDGRVLASVSIPKEFDRRAARMFRDVLRRAPRPNCIDLQPAREKGADTGAALMRHAAAPTSVPSEDGRKRPRTHTGEPQWIVSNLKRNSGARATALSTPV